MTNFKRKPASLTGAPIDAQECRQLKAAYRERFPNQVPAVFISREVIMNSIDGLSNLSGIYFAYGLDDASEAASRRIILVPARNTTNGTSAIVRTFSDNGYLCENGERVNFEKLMTLCGNHITNAVGTGTEMFKPRGYFWGINKIAKLLEVEHCAGFVFHFGFNAGMLSPCRQFQSVLEVVNASHESLNVFMEYGQCDPPCPPGKDKTGSDCIASVAAEKFAIDADNKLDVLRAFRDNWLLQQDNGQALYEMYYFLSPGIVTEIMDRADRDAILEDIYHNGFAKCLNLIRQNKYEEVKAFYVDLMYKLASRYAGQQVETEVAFV